MRPTLALVLGVHAAVALNLLPARPARARSPASWLRVESGGDPCLEGPSLEERTRGYLRGGAPTAEVEIRVRRSGDEVSFTVWREGEAVARRRFDALPDDCDAKRSAVALSIALALESAAAGTVVLEAREQDTATGSSAGETVAPAAEALPVASTDATGVDSGAPGAPATDAEAPSHGSSHRAADLSLWLGGGGLLGAPTATAWLAGLGFDLAFGWLSFGAAGLLSPETTVALYASGTGEARASQYGGQVRGCGAGRGGGVLALLCIGARGGALRGTGRGFDGSRQVTLGWAALGLGIGARFPADSTFSAAVHLDGQLNLVRPELSVVGDGGGSARASLVGAALTLELVWRPGGPSDIQ